MLHARSTRSSGTHVGSSTQCSLRINAETEWQSGTHLLCWNGIACQAQVAGVCIGGKDGHRGCHSSFCSLPCGAGKGGQINTCIRTNLSNYQASKQASMSTQSNVFQPLTKTINQAILPVFGTHQANQVTTNTKSCLRGTLY